jgi:hypothetical protein
MEVGYNGPNVRGVKKTFLLPKSRMQVTACHLAADNGNTDGLDKLWQWSKDKSVREEITRTVQCYAKSCVTDAWHSAVIVGKTSLLKKTWECCKEELTGEELHKKWFFNKDKRKKLPSTWQQGGQNKRY